MSSKPFRVIIAGGGIAGLSLAVMLEKVGIDYVLLEAYNNMVPPPGASIGILPWGSRILDQVGLYEPVVNSRKIPIHYAKVFAPEAELVNENEGLNEQNKRRYGYESVFVERQLVLDAFWKKVEKKNNAHVGKRVLEVVLSPDNVGVKTTDGDFFTGDILVGADGVHSKVRSEMWRLADSLEPGYIPKCEKTDCLPVQHQCIFGISTLKSWTKGQFSLNFNKKFSYLIVSGDNDKVFWFMFSDIGEKVKGVSVPRYSKEDMEKVLQEHLDDKLDQNHTFADLYKNKTHANITAVPEYVFKKWHFNRIITVGDAAHKVDPIGGYGGNSAIETVGVLTSTLVETLQQHPEGLTTAQIHKMFSDIQKQREPRAKEMLHASHMRQHVATISDKVSEVAIHHYVPYTTLETAQSELCGTVVNCPPILCLPKPTRKHYVPYTDELPARPLRGFLPTTVTLAFCLVFLGILGAARGWVSVPSAVSLWENTAVNKGLSGIFQLGGAWLELGLQFHTRQTLLNYIANLIPIVYIWTVEGYRNGNQLTIVRWPVLFGLYQIFGLGTIAPLYFLISAYTANRPIYTYVTGRPIPSNVARSILPATILGLIIPTILLLAQNGSEKPKEIAIVLWKFFPLYVATLTAFISRLIGTIWPCQPREWEFFENKDLSPLLMGYVFSELIPALTHLATLFWEAPLVQNSTILPWLEAISSSISVDDAFERDVLLGFAAVAAWCLYSVFTLRSLGYVTTMTALGVTVAVIIGQFLIGPGAVYAGLWAWRERVIVGLTNKV